MMMIPNHSNNNNDGRISMGSVDDDSSSSPSLCVGGGGGNNGGGSLKKGPWTAAEDTILMEYVKKHGEGNWNVVQKNSGLSRCGKSCRLRWANHLRPNLKKGSFSPEEEILILDLHAKLGNKWARMAAQNEWRAIGVQQSRGWVHYAIHHPEPHIMLFRRTLNYQQQQESQAHQMLAK